MFPLGMLSKLFARKIGTICRYRHQNRQQNADVALIFADKGKQNAVNGKGTADCITKPN